MLEFVNGADVEQATTGLLNLLGGMMEQLANFSVHRFSLFKNISQNIFSVSANIF